VYLYVRPTKFVIPAALVNNPSQPVRLEPVRSTEQNSNRQPAANNSITARSIGCTLNTTSTQPIHGPSSAATNVQGNALNAKLMGKQMSLVAGLSGANVLVTNVAGMMGLMRAAGDQGAGSGDMDKYR
jgi:hypothetical protein